MASPAPLRPDAQERPIDRILMPFQQFLRIEAAGGILLLVATALALVWANSPWAESYFRFWHTDITIGLGTSMLTMHLDHFVNDGLMAIFFFVVGLEIKREFLVGELASPRKAAIPIAAAVGGMAVPAVTYALAHALHPASEGSEAARGWAIPMATDIAFAIGIMALLGRRVPLALKVFLTALAIVDDLGAVVVIAVFYTEHISLAALGVATGMLVVSFVANRAGVRTPIVYAVIGIIMWLLLLKSGVHATVGGVLLALTIPSRMRIRGAYFATFARQAIEKFERGGGNEDDIMTNPVRQVAVRGLEQACSDVLTPLNRLEHGLHGWVAFIIMPIFALANAGVTLGADSGDAIGSGVGLGVALGLLIGKPAGVMLATFVAVRLGLGTLPTGSSWKQLFGAGCLAGVGFTMSLFIANLAFRDSGMLQLAKVGILSGSLVSGVLGFLVLRATSKPGAPLAGDPPGPR